MALIRAEHLTKVYKRYRSRVDRLRGLLALGRDNHHSEFTALADVSFEVHEGESTGIIGCNGAGKSTLLRVLAGVSPMTAGTLEVAGKIGALLQLGAGFHPDYTGAENIFINGYLMGLTKREISDKFDEIVAFSELDEFIHQPVKTYSTGMQARLAFASSTAIDPEILLIDEVLAVGDGYFVSKCIRYLQDRIRHGCTVLLVSHDLMLVKQLCQKAMWLHGGKLLEYGPVATVCEAYEGHVRENENKEILRRSRELWNSRVRKEGAKDVETGQLPRAPGPDQIKITAVQVCDRQGRERACFVSGDCMFVRVQYISAIDYLNPNFGITIERTDGLIACAASTLDEQFETGRIHKGTGYFDAVYDPLLLGPGLYRITISITLNEPLALGDTNFDRLSHVQEFKVEAKGRSYAVAVTHPVRWRHVPAADEPRT